MPITTKTDESGFYEKKLKVVGSFDICYHDSDAGIAVLTKLSGKKNQDISVILFKKNQVAEMSATSILAELSAYEFAAMLTRSEKNELSVEMGRILGNDDTRTRLEAINRRVGDMRDAEKFYLRDKISQLQRGLIFR